MANPIPLDLNLPRSRLGEAVFWDDSGRLFWTDILGQKIYIYHLGRKELSLVDTRLPVSFAFPAPSEHRIIAGLADGISLRTIA
jgi:sugar lactone lactonase YvrE